MLDWAGRLRARTWATPAERRFHWRQWLSIGLLALAFVLSATLIVAFDSLLPGRNNIATLQVGDIAPQDIRAPFDWNYESQVLTERRRQEATASMQPVYDPPDPDVSRRQVQLARQILDYIDNIRRDPFGTLEQHVNDIEQVTALSLDTANIENMLSLNDEAWRAFDTEVISVLERVMRQEIRESSLLTLRNQLPMQVSVRFNDADVRAIADIVQDLIRPNSFPNPDATEAARQAAAENTPPESRSFERGQIVVRSGQRIEPVDYEALGQLGLLQSDDRRLIEIARAFFASLIVLIISGIYIARFHTMLIGDTRLLTLFVALFLLVLLGARFFSADDQLYIFPTAALALLIVALHGPHVAIISVLGLAVLVGLMANKSLEMATLVLVGGMMGTLTLRRTERLNSFFIAGSIIALANIQVVAIFNLELLATNEASSLGLLVLYSLVNGLFAAAVALAGMYIVTLLFNLPTSLKLVELSQPNQPLLQRILREAPGTYQHSLQVANLSEQAANAIGANAELVRVAALYHDIGKILNPAFFVENQADNVNPHDVLGDPYRSADLIMSHVTDGDRLARQYRLPARIRDFILEHHGTTVVSYFYHQAIAQADDPETVDIDQFSYPGPRPQTRETAVMMLADSCESTVRARKPANRQEIVDIVQQIIDARMRDGQLDDSGLTSNDIKTIRNIFIEMLQAVFHPRINYPTLPATPERKPPYLPEPAGAERVEIEASGTSDVDGRPEIHVTPPDGDGTAPVVPVVEPLPAPVVDDDGDAPLPEVPPLRRTSTIQKVPASDTSAEKTADKNADKSTGRDADKEPDRVAETNANKRDGSRAKPTADARTRNGTLSQPVTDTHTDTNSDARTDADAGSEPSVESSVRRDADTE